MKKAILLLMMCVVFAACGEAAPPLAEAEPEEREEIIITAVPPEPPPQEDEPEIEPEPEIIEHGFTWLVEPVLEHEMVAYCSHCDVYYWFDSDDYDLEVDYIPPIKREIDRTTGLLTGETYPNHSTYEFPGGIVWLYDPDLDLFGWYQWHWDVTLVLKPMSEFAEHFPDEVDTIKPVWRVDTAMFEENNFDWDGVWTGTAIAYGNEFLTDFINGMSAAGRRQNIICLIDDDRQFGIMDKNGEMIIPFMFSWITLIDENTAFARLERDDFWGIINF
jgi:hypothetical protein